MRAIGSLGTSAESAFPHLGDYRYWWSEKNPALTAERLLAMASVSEDFARMEVVLTRALADPSAIIRTAAVRSFERFRGPPNDRAGIVRLLRNALDDEDPGVRDAAIRGLRYDRDAEVTRHIRKMSRSDRDATVRSDAFDYLRWQNYWSKLARKNGTVKDRGLERQKKTR
jgi:hypothetical protein